MPFDEQLKRALRMKAAYRCCWCERFGMVEIHHIVPQAENGQNVQANAAPLCPNCHKLYGGNPELRARMREKRDWWFSVAVKKYPYDAEPLMQSVESVDRELIAVQADSAAIRKLRSALTDYVLNMINLINPANAREAVDVIMKAVPLDNGVLLPDSYIAFEGFCKCEQQKCDGSQDKVYCYWSKNLSDWVLAKRLYWQCYDAIVECPECGVKHKRGHILKEGVCEPASQTI